MTSQVLARNSGHVGTATRSSGTIPYQRCLEGTDEVAVVRLVASCPLGVLHATGRLPGLPEATLEELDHLVRSSAEVTGVYPEEITYCTASAWYSSVNLRLVAPTLIIFL